MINRLQHLPKSQMNTSEITQPTCVRNETISIK